jgi:chemotaxis signal transduction protein
VIEVAPEAVLVPEQMRRVFDRAFAAPYSERRQDLEAFLTLRISTTAYALRVLGIAGLASARKIVPLGNAFPAMLGLTAVRGRLFPVYSLAALLGAEPAGDAPRWLVLCAGVDPVALGFTELEGHVLLPRSAIFATTGGGGERTHVRELVHAEDRVRGIIDVSSLVATIHGMIRAHRPSKE